MKYVDVAELSAIESLLRNANEVYTDRQVRVKLETYVDDNIGVSSNEKFKFRKQVKLSLPLLPPVKGNEKEIGEESEGEDKTYALVGSPKNKRKKKDDDQGDLIVERSEMRKKREKVVKVKDEIVPVESTFCTEIARNGQLLSNANDNGTNNARNRENQFISSNELARNGQGLSVAGDNGAVKARNRENETSSGSELLIPNIWRGVHPRRTLCKQLIGSMNAAFTDYDFSSVKSEQFRRVTLQQAMNNVKAHFLEMTANANVISATESNATIAKVFLQDLWIKIGEIVGNTNVIDLTLHDESLSYDPKLFEAGLESLMLGVEIYSYVVENETEIDADPLSNLGNLWSMNYFFCNAAKGKIVMLACSCRQRKFSQTRDIGNGNGVTFSVEDFAHEELNGIRALDSFDFEEPTEDIDEDVEDDLAHENAKDFKQNLVC